MGTKKCEQFQFHKLHQLFLQNPFSQPRLVGRAWQPLKSTRGDSLITSLAGKLTLRKTNLYHFIYTYFAYIYILIFTLYILIIYNRSIYICVCGHCFSFSPNDWMLHSSRWPSFHPMILSKFLSRLWACWIAPWKRSTCFLGSQRLTGGWNSKMQTFAVLMTLNWMM